MANTNDDKAAATAAAAEPAPAPAKPPVEFYAKDRWEAQTHVRAVWSVPHDVAELVRDALEGMSHPGPVHVIVHASIDPDVAGDRVGPSDVVGDGFMIRPFLFVKV